MQSLLKRKKRRIERLRAEWGRVSPLPPCSTRFIMSKLRKARLATVDPHQTKHFPRSKAPAWPCKPLAKKNPNSRRKINSSSSSSKHDALWRRKHAPWLGQRLQMRARRSEVTLMSDPSYTAPRLTSETIEMKVKTKTPSSKQIWQMIGFRRRRMTSKAKWGNVLISKTWEMCRLSLSVVSPCISVVHRTS